MADQRPVLPLTSGIGAVTPTGIDSGEQAFRNRTGLIQDFLSGIGMGFGQNQSAVPMQSFEDIEYSQPERAPDSFSITDIFSGISPSTSPSLLDVESGLSISPDDTSIMERRAEEARLAQAQAEAGKRRKDIIEGIDEKTAAKKAADDGSDTAVVTGDARESAIPDSASVKGADTPIKQATVTALDEYLKSARPGVAPKDYDEYMKEFADATGLDVSGEADNRTALMAFGLALMQNKAGKGFDVGAMLSSVGEAGEKALPELTKARSEARALRAKAGEYALSRKKEDQTAAMNRQGYYVVPRKGGFVKNFDKGRIVRLNSYELNSLDQDTQFGQDYEIIPMSVYESVAKEAFKAPELGKKYAASYDDISLFTDAPEDLRISVQRVDANYKGADKPSRGYFNPGEYDTYMSRLTAMDEGLDRFGNKVGEAFAIVDAGETTTFDQIGDAAVSIGNALGLDLTDEATPVAKVKRILNVIAADKAPEILGEAGKTISDADRERVKVIVGNLTLTSDPEELKLALREMYDRIVVGGKRDVRTGISTLNRYAGVADQPAKKKGVMTEEGVLDLTQ